MIASDESREINTIYFQCANPVIGAHHIQQTEVSIFRYVLYAVATNYNAPHFIL